MTVNTPSDKEVEELRQALDDAVLTRTGRSIGDIASQEVVEDIMPVIASLVAEAQITELKKVYKAIVTNNIAGQVKWYVSDRIDELSAEREKGRG